MTVSFRSVLFRRKSDHTTIVTIGSKTRTCRSASCFYKCQNQVGTKLHKPPGIAEVYGWIVVLGGDAVHEALEALYGKVWT